jgi:calmodulin
MFVYFDKIGNKTMKKEDLGLALRAIGYLVTTIEIRDLGIFLDPKKSGILNFE